VADHDSSAAIAARESVVAIAAEGRRGTATGSGVVLTDDGYILTNNHVVSGARSVTVTLSDGTQVAGEIVKRDASLDLAVIKVDASGLTPATLADSDKAEVGDEVYAIGSPFGLDGSITQGIISAKDRTLTAGEGSESETINHALQTDAAINPGNSGGALVNTDGHVVGINTAIASSTNSSAGIGFAIPSNTARDFAEQAIEG
jgi:putative serine protease PepD